MKVRVVVSGRNYDAARAIPEYLTLPDGASIDEALQEVSASFPPGKGLPESCLVAVSGAYLGTLGNHQPHVLSDGDELVLIAPVAGG